MEFELHFIRPPSRIANNHEVQAALLQDADLEELRRTPDPAMKHFAQDLGDILEADFPARRVISATVDTEHPFAVHDIRLAAVKHRVNAYVGTRDLLVDASGINGAIAPEFYLTNSLGTVWTQISEHTVDRAFADALRASTTEGVWVRVTSYEPRPDEFGHSMRFHLLENGEIEVVWAKTSSELVDVQWRRAGGYVDARAMLLAFADRCPTILQHYWSVPSQRLRSVLRPELCIATCDLKQRMQYRLRRLGAFRDLPEKSMLCLHDQPEFSLELGRAPEGKWRAALKRSTSGGLEKTFDNSETLLEIAEAYTRNERGTFLDYFPETAEIPEPPMHTVSAVVLPERDEPWTNSSVCRIHEFAMSRSFQAVGSVGSFLQEIMRDFASWFEVIDPETAERGQIMMKVPQEESARTFDLLTAVAMRHGVSLVVDRNWVLLNPSGRRGEGEWRSTAELFGSSQCRNRWEIATLQAMEEAMTLSYSDWQLRLTYTSEEHPGCRQILIVEPDSQILDNFSIKAYTSEIVEEGRFHGWSLKEAKKLSQGQVLDLFEQVAKQPLELDEFIDWDIHSGDIRSASNLPFDISTPTLKPPIRLDDRKFSQSLKEFASNDPGGWIEITDVRTPGDFLRIEHADNPGWVMTTWGYNHGETERGAVYASDVDETTKIYKEFVGDHWTMLEKRQIRVEPRRAQTPLFIYVPRTQTNRNHHELVQEFNANDQMDLRVPPSEMEDICRDLEELFKQKFVPQLRLEVLVDPLDTERIRGICKIALKHHALVFDADGGLLANGVGSDIQVGSGARLTNSLGSYWREVSPRTLDIAFEDALRSPHLNDAWLRVEIGRSFFRPSQALSAQLQHDGSWLLKWQFAKPVLGDPKKNLELRARNFDEAQELLLAFADRSPYLGQLPWREDEAVGAMEKVTLEKRQALPLRRFDAVIELPRGTMMPLQDKPGERLTFGQTHQGQWLATLSRDNGFVATRTFTSGQETVEFARWYVAADAAAVNSAFQAFVPSMEERFAPQGVAEVSLLVLPEREAPWANSTVLHFQRWLAQNNHLTSGDMEAFVYALQAERSDSVRFSGPQGAALESFAVTRVWVERAVFVGTFATILHLAIKYGISVVLNGRHVFLNRARTGTDSLEYCIMMKSNHSSVTQIWVEPSGAAFAESVRNLAIDEVVEVSKHIQMAAGTPAVEANATLQEFNLTVKNKRRGYLLTYEVPGGMNYAVNGLTDGETCAAFEIFIQAPSALLGSVKWHGFGQSPVPWQGNTRFEMQSNLFEPVPLGPENLHVLRAVKLRKNGDFIQVLDSQVEGDYIRVYNDGGRFRTSFIVGWGHDFGQIENFQRKTKSLDEALRLVEHYVAGDRREFIALGWKKQTVKGH